MLFHVIYDDLIRLWLLSILLCNEFIKYLLFRSNIDNLQVLQRRTKKLEDRLDIVRMRVEDREFRTGRRRKEDVDGWLNDTGAKCEEVRMLHYRTPGLFISELQKFKSLIKKLIREVDELQNSGDFDFDEVLSDVREPIEVPTTTLVCKAANMTYGDVSPLWKIIERLRSGGLIMRLIKEVDELYNEGVFDEVLPDVREPVELVTTTLVGKAAHESIHSIVKWLDEGVTKIGLHGIKGIGKTSVLMHIYNQLLRNGLDVYMIQVPAQDSEYQLQEEIMNALGFKIQQKDRIRRAALLARKLQAKNFVLIIDGLKNYLSEDKVGIPLDETRGRIIVSSRSLDVCRKTGCEKMIPLGSLPFDEAYELFRETSDLATQPKTNPVIEDLAQKIVKLCKGVPRKIVDTARELRGVHDSSEWEDYLKHKLRNSVPSSDQRSHSILGPYEWRR